MSNKVKKKNRGGTNSLYGQRLRELRKEKRWTLEEVANKIGISRSAYAGYEQETRKPTITTLIALSNLHNISVDYILGLTNDRNIKEVENNVHEYLKKDNLTWDGVPLTDEELKPIRDLLEIIVRDRLPKMKKEGTL